MIMRRNRLYALCIVLILSVLAATAAAAAPVPGKLADIPIYKGAVRNQASEKIYLRGAQSYAPYEGEKPVSVEARAWDVPGALVEDVILWYLPTLGVKLGSSLGRTDRPNSTTGPDWREFDARTKPGTTSCVEYGFERAFLGVVESETIGEGTNSDPSGNWNAAEQSEFLQKNYQEKRKKLANEYVVAMTFEWVSVDANKQVTFLSLTLRDESYLRYKTFTPTTLIHITASTFKAPALSPMAQERQQGEEEDRKASDAEEKKADEEAQKQADKNDALVAAIPAGEPTADFLGVPTYPGATYNQQMSDAFHQSGQVQFLWVSKDAPDKVAKFYEKAAGTKATGAGGGFMLHVRKKNSVTIMILDNTQGQLGPGRTAIMISIQPGG
jgi:hypothetical protein